jgi:hypothetical protein
LNTNDFTAPELAAIGTALDEANKRISEEMEHKRAATYLPALKTQQRLYESLHARVVAAAEKAA